MLPALLIAASHTPSSMWNSPSNISGAMLILVGVLGIVFALGGVWRMAG